jgi:hypothetical protein
MHPDVLIAALKAELVELRRSDNPDLDRESEVERRIAELDKQPRPVALPEEPETVYDRDREYLKALHRERAEAAQADDADHVKLIDEQIGRVKSKLDDRGDLPVDAGSESLPGGRRPAEESQALAEEDRSDPDARAEKFPAGKRRPVKRTSPVAAAEQ